MSVEVLVLFSAVSSIFNDVCVLVVRTATKIIAGVAHLDSPFLPPGHSFCNVVILDISRHCLAYHPFDGFTLLEKMPHLRRPGMYDTRHLSWPPLYLFTENVAVKWSPPMSTRWWT